MNYTVMPGLEFRNKRKLNCAHVIQIVADYFDLKVHDLTGKKRIRQIVTARHIACYILRFNYGLSTIDIGKLLNRDHSSVMHATTTVSNLLETNDDEMVDSLRGVKALLK